jgi:nitrite reductase/ring-hydroxylating ferredoxin subunit
MRVPPRMTNNQTNNPNNNTPDEPTRRSFLAKLWIALGIVAIIEIIGLIIAFFSSNKPRPAVSDTELLVEAGPVEKFALNSVTAFVRGQFYLCRLEDGGFLALSRKCTHLGCTVPWVAEENTFVCPCHSSAFNIQGEVVSPPATKRFSNGAGSIREERRTSKIEHPSSNVEHDAKRISGELIDFI